MIQANWAALMARANGEAAEEVERRIAQALTAAGVAEVARRLLSPANRDQRRTATGAVSGGERPDQAEPLPLPLDGRDEWGRDPARAERSLEIGFERVAAAALSAAAEAARPPRGDGWSRWSTIAASPPPEDAAPPAAAAEDDRLLRLALDAADLGTWRWELNRGAARVEWDGRCRALFGLPPGAAASYADWADAILPEDRVATESDIARSLDPADPDDELSREFRVRHPDGAVRSLFATGRAIFEADPSRPPGRRAVCILGTIRDVTASRRAEEARQERERRDRYLLNLEERLRLTGTAREAVTSACQALGEALGVSFVGMGEVQPDGEHTVVESEWHHADARSLLGRHRFADLGLARLAPLYRGDVVTMADVENDPRTVGDASARASYASFGARAAIGVPLMRAGRLRAILVAANAAARTWADAEVALARETLERTWHAAERARAESLLRESEARFRAITDSMPQIVWSTRPDGHADYVNARWREFTGLAEDGVEGEHWVGLIHPDEAERFLHSWRHALQTGEPHQTECRFRRRDGQYRWMLARALPVRDERGLIVRWFGTLTDVDEIVAAREVLARGQAELERLVEERTRELETSQARMAHLQRMEALGQLAGGIAHDFNNVLQAILGGASLIEHRPDDPDTVRRLARMMSEAAGRGSAITRRLLAFSRRGELRTEPVGPAPLLAEMREILSHTLGTGIGVHVEAPPELPPMLADKGQLETVLVNLAANARDAMDGRGSLTLAAAVDRLEREGEPGYPVALKPGAYLRIDVTDTGTGMAPEVLARVAEPFFTTKPPGKGTGLGLAMAKGFAEQSGGGLRIDSALGDGTTVKLWFPLAALPRAASPAPGLLRARDDARLARVLLVDDDAAVRQVIADQLLAEGFDVTPAADGPLALAVLDEGAAVDLVISDLSMPGMDGLALLREAKRRRPSLPAILLTGRATDAAEVAVSGSVALLRKPVTGQQISERAALLLRNAAGEGGGAASA